MVFVIKSEQSSATDERSKLGACKIVVTEVH